MNYIQILGGMFFFFLYFSNAPLVALLLFGRIMCFKSGFYHKCKSDTFGGWWILTGRQRSCVSVAEMGVNSLARTPRTCLVSVIIVLRSIGIF